MIKKTALILFTKNPELGKVKTRLARTIGNENALAIYKKLLRHTREIALGVTADKFLFYSDKINENDSWENSAFTKKLQVGSDLGLRILQAFSEVFALQYDSVCIIGSDCYELNSGIVNAAFQELENHEIVIGPTFDGGYYLLGMNKLYPELFQKKNWSTETVYTDTIASLNSLSLSYSTLAKLSDIDEEKDLPQHWR